MESQVTFKNNQVDIAGQLYLPAGFNEADRYPAIVCSHPAGAVKEQSPAVYAGKLANKGFVMLTFDASHQRFSQHPAQPHYAQ